MTTIMLKSTDKHQGFAAWQAQKPIIMAQAFEKEKNFIVNSTSMEIRCEALKFVSSSRVPGKI